LQIVRLLLAHGADPNNPEEGAPDGLALYMACAGNHLGVARSLLEHGANLDAGLDSCMHCVNITRVYHGEQAKPFEQPLARRLLARGLGRTGSARLSLKSAECLEIVVPHRLDILL
jgi:hypothetical protein